MKSTHPTMPNHAIEKASVEFYPSVDDLTHISSVLQRAAPRPIFHVAVYQLFLFINAAVFPAYLLYSDRPLSAIGVLVLNLIAVILLMPFLGRRLGRSYYDALIPTFEDQLTNVDLGPDGITTTRNGNVSFVPWTNITDIDEQPKTIFFFFGHNAVAVRKNGFAYADQITRFTDIARQSIAKARCT